MAYRNLYTPLSQFVDPQSTEIAQELRAKYLTSFQAQDQVAQALSQLPVASFENDQKIYNDLYNNTRTEIDGLAERGDYENMFMPVSRLASRYRNTAAPLETNYNRYQEDVKSKREMLDKGDITMSDYEGWLKKSRLTQGTDDYTPYLGIELDDNGRAVQSSYYGGTPIAQYVDIQKEILTQLNQIPEVKRGGGEIVQYQTVDGLQYAVTEKGQIQEFVPPDAVRAVTENILRRPDVQAYMTQSSDFLTMELDEASLDAILAGQAQYLRGVEESAGAAEVEKILNTGSLGTKRRAAQSIAYNKEASNYLNTALATRQPSAYGGKFAIKYDDALTKKLEDRQLGSFQPIFPGQEYVLVNPSVADENGNVTPESVRQSMATAKQRQAAGVETLLEYIPSLAEGLEMNNIPQATMSEYINSSLSNTEGVEQLVQAALLADPDADAPTIRREINNAKMAYDYYQADIQLGEQMIKNSYEDFGESLTVNIIADYATDKNVTAELLPDYMSNLPLDANYTYDDESNSIIINPGQAPTQGADVAANIVFVKSMVDGVNQDWLNGTLRDAGVDKASMLSDIVQQTLGLDDAAARDLIAIASQVEVSYEGGARGQRSGLPNTSDIMSSAGRELGSQLYNEARNARIMSTENLEKAAAPSYSFGVSNAALGDDKKGTLSKKLNEGIKGYPLENIGNIPIVPTRGSINQEAATIEDLVGNNYKYAEVKDVDYTQIVTPLGVEAALVLNIGKIAGAPSGITFDSNTVTVPYSSMVLDYFPGMEDLVTNATTPGAKLVNNVLGLALNHPGGWSEETGIVMQETVAGRDIKINLFPQIERGGEDVEIIAGIGKVIVTSSGAGVEERETVFNDYRDFIVEYNKIKAKQPN